jgi:hypothetical protein
LRDRSKEGLHRSKSAIYCKSFLGKREREREREREKEKYEVNAQSLARQVGAVLESLRKDCSG